MKKALITLAICAAGAISANAQGIIYAHEEFDWLQPFVDAFNLSDPVGTDNADNVNFINFEPGNSQKVDGKNPMNIFWDELGYRTRVWPQSACYEIFAYKNYLRFGGNEARNYGVMTAGMRWLSEDGCPRLPDYPDELYLSFDWCPYKTAEGAYDEIELMVETRMGADIANETEIRHDLEEGDPMRWIHVEIDLYETGTTTPHIGPKTNYMIQPIPAYQTGGKHRYYLDNLMLHTERVKESAVEDVAVDANAPVEFYTLQGIRVAAPKAGIYIRRQGNKATKVIFD